MRGENPTFIPVGSLNDQTSQVLTQSKEFMIEFLKHQTNLEWGGNRLYDGSQTHMHQNPWELTEFVFHLMEIEDKENIKFNNFLSIGFLDGSTDTILNKVFNFEEIVAADNFSERGNGDVLRANLRYKNLTLICGDSTSDRVKNRIEIMGPYELAFVDANHDYEYVKKDFYTALSVVTPNGVIGLHDVRMPQEEGTQRFWRELCASDEFEAKTIFNENSPKKTGIGVIRRKNRP